MTYDMNDAQPQVSGELIPDGTYAKVAMHIRKGGVDGAGELDKGLLKASNQPGSDVLSLDTEFTVLEGPHARRKFWQAFTVSGGKLDEEGQSIGWKISKSTFRAMIDSALGLNPEDMSDAAKSRRVLNGLSELSGITFIGKVKIEPSDNPRYPDRNRLERVVHPQEPEWQKVMNGEHVPAAPSSKPRAAPKPETPPAWGQGNSAAPAAAAKPAWGSTLAATAAPQQASTPAAPAAAPATKPGPAWLAG